MNLAQRTLRSGAWSVAANGIKVIILFGRSIILARLLPVDAFGTYVLAYAIVTLTGIIPLFGLGGALLHRSPESADEPTAAATHFTLTLGFTVVWAAVLVSGTLWLSEAPLQPALITLTLIYAGLYLTETPRTLLTRRVDHQRLAQIDIAETVLASAVAVYLALRGATVAALVATDAVALLVATVGLYLWRPIWRPRLLWARETAAYFLQFGSRNMVGIALGAAIDRVDDIWTGAVLGPTSLGFYSRAYTFATYPRRVLAYPINNVTSGTLAELKDDRPALSQAFIRTNALLVRTGFLAAGLLFLIAPELVTILLGDKWGPMITPFRLLLVYALFDPVRATMSGLFVAAGRPEQLIQSRAIQILVLLAGLALLGPLWGINGVAVAVNLMLVVGLAIQTVQARAYVDFSAARLFAVPALALLLGLALAWVPAQVLCEPMSFAALCANPWATGLLKSVAFVVPFAAVMLAFERQQIHSMWQSARSLWSIEGTSADGAT
jgi:O-antigen/teichoic acid export membrane protein